MEDKVTLLSKISLFEELSMDELKLVDAISTMRPVKKGTVVLSPSHPLQALFLLKKGQVRLYRLNSEGRQFTTDILVDGNVFGQTDTFALTDSETYAEAMTDTYLCIMAQEEFKAFMAQRPNLAMKLLNILSERLRETYDLSERIALADVRSRILYLLIRLSERRGRRQGAWQTVDMRLTHWDLATMVGSSRETVSAIMSELKRNGMLRRRLFAYALNADKAREQLGFPEF